MGGVTRKEQLLLGVHFWATKILTNGMGETTSDFLAHLLNPVIAVGFGAIFFLATLILQFAAMRYIQWAYWLAVVAMSIFGSTAADTSAWYGPRSLVL